MAWVRVSVEEHCVLCEVRTFSRARTAVTLSDSVRFSLKLERFHVLKRILVNITTTLCTLLDTRKDQ